MKRRFIYTSLVLALFTGITVTHAKTDNSLSLEQAKQPVILKDLNFKTVMMAFYQKQLKHIVIPELDQEKVSYVGINKAEHTGISDDQPAVLIFSPAETYETLDHQQRYLFTVTEIAVDSRDNRLNFCGACASFTRVFIFKKKDGKFEFVNQSDDEFGWMNGDFNFKPYPSKSIIENIQKIGPNTQGYIEKQEYSRQGYSDTYLYIMPLNEKSNLLKTRIAHLEWNNEVSGSDEIYNTIADYRFLSTVHDGLFDIEIKYTGTDRQETEKGFKIVAMNETHIYQYNSKKQNYIRTQ